MDWVKAKNAATLAELAKSPLYAPTFERTKKILDSKDKIAYPEIMAIGSTTSGRTRPISAGCGGGQR